MVVPACQEAAGLIEKHMASKGVKFIKSTVPTAIEKQPDGKLLVHFKTINEADGSETAGSEVFDTVLSAIGRNADLGVSGVLAEWVRDGSLCAARCVLSPCRA